MSFVYVLKQLITVFTTMVNLKPDLLVARWFVVETNICMYAYNSVADGIGMIISFASGTWCMYEKVRTIQFKSFLLPSIEQKPTLVNALIYQESVE